jgi:hypothetical protein
MLFGVSKEIITPPFKMQIACTGEYLKNFESVHDDVYVRCLVLKNSNIPKLLKLSTLPFCIVSLTFKKYYASLGQDIPSHI